jgi:hypothetical protein
MSEQTMSSCKWCGHDHESDAKVIAALREGIGKVIGDMENGWEGAVIVSALRQLVDEQTAGENK